jgi:phage baseplate assembly protein V
MGQEGTLLRRLRTRVTMMVARAVVKTVDDATKMQLLQLGILAGELRDKVEHFQSYGFTSVPFPGAEAVVVFPGGNREHGLCVVVDDRRYRLTGLDEGEVALFDDQEQKVHLKRDGIEISTEHKVTVTAPQVIVDSEDVILGGSAGGAKVARVGDRVNVGSGSSAGMWPIVEGADNVKAI